ncbi:hypothetical protein CFP65_2338 [Kitasatospora sp. MMS16-BH015]|uniref:hypothetical protein n=1 Tax=Kitasatospora sp. MMS16-BH015 TaxID=2018025 RepID=UPI000CA20535|nr:hypothetical protein [Kitasatospora sp. MMS16-BH015]AUG77176.1 hypothetical protein CFP65_2338 [Kitasatospora sp. MMS16-BH015]
MSTPTDTGSSASVPGTPASYGAFPGPTSSFGPPLPPAPPTPPTPTPRPARITRRGLFWALGGAVVASAVWATAVLTVPDLVTPTHQVPDSHGYHLVPDLCAAARFNRFSQLYPAQSGQPYHYTTRHPALDDMYCSEYLKKSPGDTEYYSLYLEAQLHKEMDPAPEFAAQKESLRQRRYQITEVPALGNEAYVGFLDDPSTSDRTWHYLTQVIYVRDGGLTYYLSWSGSYQDGHSAPPDRDSIRQALMMDTRDVLRALGPTVPANL